jgi:phytoene dehydrogenase-like protein
VVQPSLFDPTRAPEGKHTLWAYCHVPHGSREDMSSRIEDQIERFAPGFKKLILARSLLDTAALEAKNPNLVGGDISGGSVNFFQLLFRPTSPWAPYATPDPSIFFCSSSTPPGPGVHGMCGWQAAQAALASKL